METRFCLKDFDILIKLGQGSFGSVYKVLLKRNIHIGDRKICVLKCIRCEYLGRRYQNIALNEVKILSQLQNPYIVKYMGSFIENNYLNIVMEFCEKGDLHKLIR